MSAARDVNLIGALVTALQDELEAATTSAAAHGSAFPAALVTIEGEPGMSIDRLRRVLGLSHSGAVRLLDRLESDGMVRRKAGPDGRTVALELTAAGRRQAGAVQEGRRVALDRALSPLSQRERRQLVQLAETLLAGLTRDTEHSEHICRLCDLGACPEADCPVACAARHAGH
jgi:DNA-binding MarR family transcriptional regulator